MIHTVNYILTRVFDFILYPFQFINPFWGILFLSVLMSFVVLYMYKWVSSPKLIKRTKDQVKASILAIRLYKDLWKVIVISFFKSLYYTFKYFALNLVPLLIIIPVLFPVFVQMDIRYGMRPFYVGEEFAVKAKFSGSIEGKDIVLQDNSHFKTSMNPVFIRALNEVNWKLETVNPGISSIKIKVGDRIYEKTLMSGVMQGAVSNKVMNRSSWSHFVYPAEKLLPGEGEVESISIMYPARDITFGFTSHWLVFNLILVVVIVLALKKRFGIEF